MAQASVMRHYRSPNSYDVVHMNTPEREAGRQEKCWLKCQFFVRGRALYTEASDFPSRSSPGCSRDEVLRGPPAASLASFSVYLHLDISMDAGRWYVV